MELRQLRYFVAVAETRSLRNAVERLHIAQPALSQSIKLLEDELGAELFVRSRKGMELTSTGAVFLENAKLILSEVARAKESVRDAEENPSGTVSVAMVPSVSGVLAVPLFKEVKKQYPNIVLNLEEHTVIDVRRSFETGVYDLMVYLQVEGIEHIKLEPLLREELYLACKYSKQQKLPAEIDFAKLQDYPLTFPQVPFNVDRTVGDIGRRQGMAVNTTPNKVAIPTLVKLIREGVANSVVPWTLVHEAVKDKEIAAARVVNPCVTRTIHLITPTNHHLSYASLAVAETIRQITRSLHEQDVWRGELLLP